jgi:hypothetical protein
MPLPRAGASRISVPSTTGSSWPGGWADQAPRALISLWCIRCQAVTAAGPSPVAACARTAAPSPPCASAHLTGVPVCLGARPGTDGSRGGAGG